MTELQHIDIGTEGSSASCSTSCMPEYPERSVWVFGSRVRHRAKRRSDLDLAIGGAEPLRSDLTADLKEDFLRSDLPYFVDVVDLASVTPEFKRIIESDFVPIQALEPLARGSKMTQPKSKPTTPRPSTSCAKSAASWPSTAIPTPRA